jgi:hypothetical protein
VITSASIDVWFRSATSPDLLRNTKFADDIPNIAKSFDKTTKLTFRNIQEPQYIKFGRASDRDVKLNIRAGQLKLLG